MFLLPNVLQVKYYDNGKISFIPLTSHNLMADWYVTLPVLLHCSN